MIATNLVIIQHERAKTLPTRYSSSVNTESLHLKYILAICSINGTALENIPEPQAQVAVRIESVSLISVEPVKKIVESHLSKWRRWWRRRRRRRWRWSFKFWRSRRRRWWWRRGCLKFSLHSRRWGRRRRRGCLKFRLSLDDQRRRRRRRRRSLVENHHQKTETNEEISIQQLPPPNYPLLSLAC